MHWDVDVRGNASAGTIIPSEIVGEMMGRVSNKRRQRQKGGETMSLNDAAAGTTWTSRRLVTKSTGILRVLKLQSQFQF